MAEDTIGFDDDSVRDLRLMRRKVLGTSTAAPAGGTPAGRQNAVFVQIVDDIADGDVTQQDALLLSLVADVWVSTGQIVRVRLLTAGGLAAGTQVIAKPVSNLGLCVEASSAAAVEDPHDDWHRDCCGPVLHEGTREQSDESMAAGFYQIWVPSVQCCPPCPDESVITTDTAIAITGGTVLLTWDDTTDTYASDEADCGTLTVRWELDVVARTLSFVEDGTTVLAVWDLPADVPWNLLTPIKFRFKEAVAGCYVCVNEACVRPVVPLGPCTGTACAGIFLPYSVDIEFPDGTAGITEADDGGFTQMTTSGSQERTQVNKWPPVAEILERLTLVATSFNPETPSHSCIWSVGTFYKRWFRTFTDPVYDPGAPPPNPLNVDLTVTDQLASLANPYTDCDDLVPGAPGLNFWDYIYCWSRDYSYEWKLEITATHARLRLDRKIARNHTTYDSFFPHQYPGVPAHASATADNWPTGIDPVPRVPYTGVANASYAITSGYGSGITLAEWTLATPCSFAERWTLTKSYDIWDTEPDHTIEGLPDEIVIRLDYAGRGTPRNCLGSEEPPPPPPP